MEKFLVAMIQVNYDYKPFLSHRADLCIFCKELSFNVQLDCILSPKQNLFFGDLCLGSIVYSTETQEADLDPSELLHH